MPRKPYSTAAPDAYAGDGELIPQTRPGGEQTSTVNEINLQVQHAHEQLLDLRRQQEEIERQKKELEELSRKQREFDDGRREIVEKLTRGLVLLEREEFETKRELEQIKIVRDSFSEHLSQTAVLNPAEAPGEELSTELTKALARIDQAKAIYGQSKARLTALREADEGLGELPELDAEFGPAEKSFGSMVREGFAYSLPLLLVLAAVALVYFTAHH